MTQHIERLFDSYVAKCFDEPLPPDQITEIRRAFYGGCLAGWVLLKQHPAPLMRLLVKREIDAFRDDVMEGRK